MGTHRTPEQMTFLRELARLCLEQTPGYPGKLWQHSSVQTRMEEGQLLYWAAITVYGLGEPYYIMGEITRDGRVLSSGTCEVVAGADVYTAWCFRFTRVDDRLQIELTETRHAVTSRPTMAALAEAYRTGD